MKKSVFHYHSLCTLECSKYVKCCIEIAKKIQFIIRIYVKKKIKLDIKHHRQ